MRLDHLESRVGKLEKALSAFSQELRLALRYVQPDAGSSLTKSRVVMERLLAKIYKAEMGQEPRKPLIGDMLVENQFTRHIERRILSRINAIREMGNLGPHGEAVEPNDAARVLDDLCEVLEWYLRRYVASDPATTEDGSAASIESIDGVLGQDSDRTSASTPAQKLTGARSDDLANYQRAAENGDREAQYQLGSCYDIGAHVQKDASLAAEWYLKAAEHGHPEAQFKLGLFSYSLKISPSSSRFGNDTLAKLGLRNTGKIEDSATDPNYVRAVDWFRKAAMQGHAEAQYWTGLCYESGIGTPKQMREAGTWYRKAADQGFASAQYKLGYFYQYGHGIGQNFAEAAHWYELAARQGNQDAQFALGCCFRDGDGIPEDWDRAAQYFRLAAARGSTDAQQALEELGAAPAPPASQDSERQLGLRRAKPTKHRSADGEPTAGFFNERATREGKIQVYRVTNLSRWPYETVESQGYFELGVPIELKGDFDQGTKYRCVSSRSNQSIDWGLLTHNFRRGKDGKVLASARAKLPTEVWIQIDFRLFRSARRADDQFLSRFRDHLMAKECDDPPPEGEVSPTQVRIGSDNDPYYQWFDMGEKPRGEITYVFVSTTAHLEYINSHTIPDGIAYGYVGASVVHLRKYTRPPTYAELFAQFDRLNTWFEQCGGRIAD